MTSASGACLSPSEPPALARLLLAVAVAGVAGAAAQCTVMFCIMMANVA